MTQRQLAAAFNAAFETVARDDTSTYSRLQEGSPEWMTDAIRAAHLNGELMPHDWVYDACNIAASYLAESNPDTWDDQVSEWADALVDVYNTDRLQWLGSSLHFAYMVDDAVKEFGHGETLLDDIGLGQYHFLHQMIGALVAAIREQADEEEEA